MSAYIMPTLQVYTASYYCIIMPYGQYTNMSSREPVKKVPCERWWRHRHTFFLFWEKKCAQSRLYVCVSRVQNHRRHFRLYFFLCERILPSAGAVWREEKSIQYHDDDVDFCKGMCSTTRGERLHEYFIRHIYIPPSAMLCNSTPLIHCHCCHEWKWAQ